MSDDCTGAIFQGMQLRIYLFSIWILAFPFAVMGQVEKTIYQVQSGKVQFASKARQEFIQASSDQLLGFLDISRETFAFKIPIASFAGFNGALQQEHFNENYMESDLFPDAIYVGKIIESIDFSKKGSYEVRTKGNLTIHGVTQQCIIKANIHIIPGEIEIDAAFTVMLQDYNIKIPRIVNNNLSKAINVKVKAVLIPKQTPG